MCERPSLAPAQVAPGHAPDAGKAPSPAKQASGGCPHARAVPDERAMQRAIDLSAQGGLVEKTGGCFGAVVVDTTTGEVVGEAFNRVVADVDPSAHAEVLAIRRAAKKLGRPHLGGCVLYSSAQPCPMCHCTALWAHIDRVFYGATYEDVMEYGQFQDADFLAEMLKPSEEKDMPVQPYLRGQAVKPWIKFQSMPDRVHY